MQIILIQLPLPSRSLSPNGRSHFFRKAKATKAYRQAAWLATVQAGGRRLYWPAARAQATFYWPNQLRRDVANAEASLKAAYDGIVDAGLIKDDRAGVLSHEPSIFLVDPKRPRVEIRVTQA